MEFFSVEINKAVASVNINRPPANALSSGVLKELSVVLDELENNNDVRVIVLKGEGRFFSAGADIKEFTTIPSGKEFSDLARLGQSLFDRMEKFSKPIVGVIHGAALGGGLELAMACHIRLVSEKAKLGLPELQLGLVPGFAGSQRLPKYVGVPKALEMMYTSEPISGVDAAKFGLANQAYAEEELFDKAYEMAEKIAAKSPITTKFVNELMQYVKTDQFDQGVEKEAEYFGAVFESEDGQEGIDAFMNKRSPEFKGK